MNKFLILFSLSTVFALPSSQVQAVETTLKGLVDVRVHSTDSNRGKSYLTGEYGKFRYNDGTGLALGQLGAQLHLDWHTHWSGTVVANAFANQGSEAIGISEAFIAEFTYKRSEICPLKPPS